MGDIDSGSGNDGKGSEYNDCGSGDDRNDEGIDDWGDELSFKSSETCKLLFLYNCTVPIHSHPAFCGDSLCEQKRSVNWRCRVIALHFTNTANLCIQNWLPIFLTYSGYPRIPPVRIGRKKIKMEARAFWESIGTMNCTATFAHNCSDAMRMLTLNMAATSPTYNCDIMCRSICFQDTCITWPHFWFLFCVVHPCLYGLLIIMAVIHLSNLFN